MANKTVPTEDKQLVLQRLAEGQSTRQAIEGTSIASNQTAARLVYTESHTIKQLREAYVKQINHYAEEGQASRAAMLADMIWAKKYIRKPIAKYYSQYKDSIEYFDTLIEVPDWALRLKVIQYIDQLAGIAPMQRSQVNVLQQMNNQN